MVPKRVPRKHAVKIEHWDDERRIGNGIFVTLKRGHCFDEPGTHVFSEYTFAEVLDSLRSRVFPCSCKECSTVLDQTQCRTWFGDIGEVAVTAEECAIFDCGSGRHDVTEYVREHLGAGRIELSGAPDDIRKQLRKYGAWDKDELEDDGKNRLRLAWLGCYNLLNEESDSFAR